jgi:transcriptional regulator with XRE-family HTH domain
MAKDGSRIRPGQRLKTLRASLGITTRDVETHSRQIADSHRHADFYVSHSSLLDVENADHVPSVHKLYSLSVIYRISFIELLSVYGIDLDQISAEQLSLRLPRTHPAKAIVYNSNRRMRYPLRVDSSISVNETNLLSRIVQTWGEVPIAFVQHFDLRRFEYAFIGLKDFTMSPMIRPGAMVQIDNQNKNLRTPPWESEFERPIFFFKLPKGWTCGWFQLTGRSLSIVPHSLSPAPVRRFLYPDEVEVVGRVTGIATSLVAKSGAVGSRSEAHEL